MALNTTPPTDDSILVALLTAAFGSLAAVYQDAIIVVIGATFGGLLSLQRAPTRELWRGLWHVAQCFGLALLLTDAGAAMVTAEVPQRWAISRHTIMAVVALGIAWAWPDGARAAGGWCIDNIIKPWLTRRGGDGSGGGT